MSVTAQPERVEQVAAVEYACVFLTARDPFDGVLSGSIVACEAHAVKLYPFLAVKSCSFWGQGGPGATLNTLGRLARKL